MRPAAGTLSLEDLKASIEQWELDKERVGIKIHPGSVQHAFVHLRISKTTDAPEIKAFCAAFEDSGISYTLGYRWPCFSFIMVRNEGIADKVIDLEKLKTKYQEVFREQSAALERMTECAKETIKQEEESERRRLLDKAFKEDSFKFKSQFERQFSSGAIHVDYKVRSSSCEEDSTGLQVPTRLGFLEIWTFPECIEKKALLDVLAFFNISYTETIKNDTVEKGIFSGKLRSKSFIVIDAQEVKEKVEDLKELGEKYKAFFSEEEARRRQEYVTEYQKDRTEILAFFKCWATAFSQFLGPQRNGGIGGNSDIDVKITEDAYSYFESFLSIKMYGSEVTQYAMFALTLERWGIDFSVSETPAPFMPSIIWLEFKIAVNDKNWRLMREKEASFKNLQKECQETAVLQGERPASATAKPCVGGHAFFPLKEEKKKEKEIEMRSLPASASQSVSFRFSSGEKPSEETLAVMVKRVP